MGDQELLELAAKSIGGSFCWNKEGIGILSFGAKKLGKYWNPLKSDGDSARLMTACFIDVQFASDYVIARGPQGEVHEIFSADRATAMRRAITRAAAEVGMVMP